MSFSLLFQRRKSGVVLVAGVRVGEPTIGEIRRIGADWDFYVNDAGRAEGMTDVVSARTLAALKDELEARWEARRAA